MQRYLYKSAFHKRKYPTVKFCTRWSCRCATLISSRALKITLSTLQVLCLVCQKFFEMQCKLSAAVATSIDAICACACCAKVSRPASLVYAWNVGYLKRNRSLDTCKVFRDGQTSFEAVIQVSFTWRLLYPHILAIVYLALVLPILTVLCKYFWLIWFPHEFLICC